MQLTTVSVTLIVATFVLAGLVKGVTGMGLPTVAIGLLGLLMIPARAAALLVIPSLVTNVWQYLAGQRRILTLRRLAVMLLAIFVATWFSSGLIVGEHAAGSSIALGIVLIAYALVGLANVQMKVSIAYEAWLSPIVGAATGVVTGATGVFVIPAVPYLQALGLRKDDLVQALGLSFTVSTIALAAGLANKGAFHLSSVGISIACTVPALVGMFLGQGVRRRVNGNTFRRVFFLALLLLGTDLALRSFF
jgi:uncharacterized membrane protein YfcA